MRITLTYCSFALLLAADRLHAEPESAPESQPKSEAEQEGESIVIDATPAAAAERRAEKALSDAGLVTRIDVADARPSATLADVIGQSVGADVRSVGGLGGFASVSVRGLGAGHTPVIVDGVPLSRVSTAEVDLSQFDLHSFGEVALYRGAVPADLGARGLGGALELRSAVGREPGGESAAISAGLGSFGARHVRGRLLGGDRERFGYQLGVGYAGATGDYSFFDDNGTNLNTTDDRRATRTNNGFDRIDATLRALERRGSREIRGGARVMLKRQGLPGIGSRQTDRASLESATGILDTSVVGLGLGTIATASANGFVIFDVSQVSDRGGEIGLGAGNSESNVLTFGLGAAATARPPGTERARLALDTRLDHFTLHSGLGAAPELRSEQIGGRATVALTADAVVPVGDRARLVPSVRAEFVSTDALGGAARNDVTLSPTVAGLLRATPSISAKASASYAVRQPTIVELFGDRGILAGTPELLAERGPAADVGVVWAPIPGASMPIDRVLATAAAFWSRPEDAIVYVPSAGGVSRPLNIDGAESVGVELSASARFLGHTSATANYTHLDARARSSSETMDGNQLPHRARHQLYARVADERSVLGRSVSVWVDASFASGNVLDQANVIELPARHFFGAGVALKITPRLSLAIDGRNLTDNTVETIELDPPPRPDLTRVPRPVSDFFGYPLPGRAFYATARAHF